MKKAPKIVLCIALALLVLGTGIGLHAWWRSVKWPNKAIEMKMHTDFPDPENLPNGNGKRVKVILLAGQSNATGVGRIKYLKANTTPERFAKYESGFESVHINYCVDK